MDQFLEISSPARIRVRNGQMLVEQENAAHLIPFDDIGILMVSSAETSFSQGALTGIADSGGIAVFCDRKFLPSAMLLPVSLHGTQTSRIAEQTAMPLPRKKQVWRALVQAKLRSQGRLLRSLRGNDRGLLALSGRVRSGDPDNYEAQGARRYWPALLGASFVRDRNAPGLNAMLNYGYMVLRAMCARAICSCGYHPSIGVHHITRTDPFVLASDFMEPFRPVVDHAVAIYGPAPDALGREERKALLEALSKPYELHGEPTSLFPAMRTVILKLMSAEKYRHVASRIF